MVVASALLSSVQREQGKIEKLEELNVGFWKAVRDQDEPLKVIRLTRNLEDVQEALTGVVESEEKCEKLVGPRYVYGKLQETIKDVSAKIVKLDQAIGLRFILDTAESELKALDALEDVNRRFLEANVEEKGLREKVSSMGNTEALRDILDGLSKRYEQIDNLKRLNAVYTSRQLSCTGASKFVETCKKELEEAEKELHDAWEAAGGVCPLCGSEVSENCIH